MALRRPSPVPSFFEVLSDVVGDDRVVLWATVRRSMTDVSLVGGITLAVRRLALRAGRLRGLAARLVRLPEGALLVLSDSHLLFHRLDGRPWQATVRLGPELARYELDELALVEVRRPWTSRGLASLELSFVDGTRGRLRFAERGVHGSLTLPESFAAVGVPVG